jgi:hypothetical protein
MGRRDPDDQSIAPDLTERDAPELDADRVDVERAPAQDAPGAPAPARGRGDRTPAAAQQGRALRPRDLDSGREDGELHAVRASVRLAPPAPSLPLVWTLRVLCVLGPGELLGPSHDAQL